MAEIGLLTGDEEKPTRSIHTDRDRVLGLTVFGTLTLVKWLGATIYKVDYA